MKIWLFPLKQAFYQHSFFYDQRFDNIVIVSVIVLINNKNTQQKAQAQHNMICQ